MFRIIVVNRYKITTKNAIPAIALLPDSSYRSDAAAHQVAFADEELGVEGQEDIQPRAELDHTEDVSLGAVRALDGVALDPAGHYAGDLAEEDVNTGGGADSYAGVLVLLRALGIHSEDFPAGIVFDIADLAGNRIPVDVDVEEGHKDRHSDAPVVEILVLLDFLYGDDVAVARRDHQRVVNQRLAVGYAEESRHEK